ncbi:MAG: sugar nucleotide-binding protein, partial [Alphaproteobacteria bacterium]
MRRILVTGRGGQLATGLEAALPAQGFEALLVGQPEFEFDKPETVIAAFAALKPDAVVNCPPRPVTRMRRITRNLSE